MPTSFTLALFCAALPAGLPQDVQTSNDWATGSAHAAVIDSINRNNVARTRRTGVRASAPHRFTPAERARNCAFLRRHLARLDTQQLRSYRIVCRPSR